MIPFPLALRRATATRPVAAWFVPGDDAAAWIAEMAAWGLPMSGHRLYLAPAAGGDRRVGGLLVLPGGGRAAKATARARGYALFGERLLLPVDAELDPPVAPEELVRRLPGPLYWLHPGVGLVMFSDEEALRVRDLVEPPAAAPRRWDRAQSGISRPPRLVSVEPEVEPTVQDVLDDAREDIGSQNVEEMPEEGAPEESSESGEPLTKQAKRKALEALNWLTERAPEKASEPTWVNRVQDWARKKLKGMDPKLRQERNRELAKLLQLLKDDPDKGLKYAIPMRGSGSRGLAEPGARLGAHGTDFDLSRLGGGRPADSWDAPYELRQRLIEEYRAAALAALKLGRHRRAAYIYAELLGDFDSAANALRQGRHFREAAVLYKDRLKKPLEAARCLEEGGLLVEAIPIYEALGQHMKVGELCERLERPEEAAAAYRQAANALIGAGDLVRAAQVLEQRVHAPDDALELLESGWPRAAQAALCLREQFALLARLARHDQALKRAEALRGAGAPEGKLVVLAGSLTHVARTYPDARVRDCCSDFTRVLAAEGLEDASDADAAVLVRAVAELVPADRQLDRDAHRFLERRRKRSGATPPPRTTSHVPLELRALRLAAPGEITWSAAAACGDHFYALGLHRTLKPTLLRGTFDGRYQSVQWSQGLSSIPRAILEPPQGTGTTAIVWLPGGAALGPRVLAANDRLVHTAEVGTPSWLPDQTIGLTRDETDTAWLLRREGQLDLLLESHSASGALLGTISLESGPQSARVNLLARSTPNRPAPALPVPMAARQQHVFVALGNRLLHVYNREKFRPTELVMDARELVLSSHALVLAVVGTEGVTVLWPSVDGDRHPQQHFGDGRRAPLACFTRANQLVLLFRDEGQVIAGPGGRMEVVATFRPPTEPAVALLTGDRKDEFAILTADGALRVYRIPG